MADNCLTCRFYDKYNNSQDEGLCRKEPPKPLMLVGSPDAVAMWPEVKDDDWCGGHESKVERHPLNLVDDAVAKERQRCLDVVAKHDDIVDVILLAELIVEGIKSPC